MKRFSHIFTCLTLMAASAFAAKPIATVTSAQPFTLDGHSVNTPGVTSFPVVMGDTVSTIDGPAVIRFPEGSQVKLEANSTLKISGVDQKPRLMLLGGAVDYKLMPGSGLSVTNVIKKEVPAAPVAVASAHIAKRPGVAMLPKAAAPAPAPEPVAEAAAPAAENGVTASLDDDQSTDTDTPKTGGTVPNNNHPVGGWAAIGALLTAPKFIIPALVVGAAGVTTAVMVHQSSVSVHL
jgi:hypothetical protein